MLHVGPERVLRHSGNCHLSLLDDYPVKKSVWPAKERPWRVEFIISAEPTPQTTRFQLTWVLTHRPEREPS